MTHSGHFSTALGNGGKVHAERGGSAVAGAVDRVDYCTVYNEQHCGFAD
jgi:hypothetical protein